MRKVIGVLLAITSLPAFSAIPNSVPEPGALSLLGIGAVAGLLVWATKRNKK